MRKRGRIVLLHFVGQMPMAGIAWQAVNHLAGLEKLGYEVWYVEDHGTNPYDPRINSVVNECDYNVAYLRAAMERHGFAGRWAYWDAINDVWHGMSREAVHRLYAEADALINLCGATRLREEHMRVPARVMIDTDPVYEQIKYAKERAGRARLYRRAHAFLHLRRQSRHRLCARCRCAACPGARRGRRSISICGRSPPIPRMAASSAVSRRSRPGKTGARTSNSRARTTSGRNMSIFVRFLDLPRRRPESCFEMAMLPPDDGVRREVEGQWLAPRRSAPGIGRHGQPIAGSSPARAASSPSPRTSMSGRTAAGSATAPSATWRAAVPSSRCAPALPAIVRSGSGAVRLRDA